MADKPQDQKGPHERVSFGDKALESRRRSGVTLARPGHFSALSYAASVQRESSSKAGRPAIRAKIKPSHQPDRKD
jgi:hypothetical protein